MSSLCLLKFEVWSPLCSKNTLEHTHLWKLGSETQPAIIFIPHNAAMRSFFSEEKHTHSKRKRPDIIVGVRGSESSNFSNTTGESVCIFLKPTETKQHLLRETKVIPGYQRKRKAAWKGVHQLFPKSYKSVFQPISLLCTDVTYWPSLLLSLARWVKSRLICPFYSDLYCR